MHHGMAKNKCNLPGVIEMIDTITRSDITMCSALDTLRLYGPSDSLGAYMAMVGVPTDPVFATEDFGGMESFTDKLKEKVSGILKSMTKKADDANSNVLELSAGIDQQVDRRETVSKVKDGVLAAFIATALSLLTELNRLTDIKPDQLYDNNMITLAQKYRERRAHIEDQIKSLKNDMTYDVERKSARQAGKSVLTAEMKNKVRQVTQASRVSSRKVVDAIRTLFRPGYEQSMSATRVVIGGILIWGVVYMVMRILHMIKANLATESDDV